jgi:branched-chain amino acid transport system permease protein
MDYVLHILILWLIYAIFAMSLNLELGYTGLYNFGHVAFFGIGAYVSALLSLAGMPVPLAALCALIAAGAAGMLLAVPALRLTGDYFGVATLVFAEMLRLFSLNERWLTKGPMGLPGIPRPPGISGGVAGLAGYLGLCIVVAAAVFALLGYITASAFGRALKVVREDPYVAKALGKNVFSLQARSVCLGSALAGVAGLLYAHYITYISPADFTLNETVLVLLCVVLGGSGTRWGPVLGALLVIFFGEMIRFLPVPVAMEPVVAPVQGMVYGAVLVAMMLKRPGGLWPEHGQ